MFLNNAKIPKAMMLISALSLFLGTGLRLFDQGRQVFWHDEVHTALRIFGFSTQELENTLFDGKLHLASELQRFQRPDPQKGFCDTMRSLAGHPEHGPLYYLMARVVAPFFNPPLAGARVLSGLIGLFLLIFVYRLAGDLFPENPLIPWVSVTITSLSPFFILYAREARQYSLWALFTTICMIWFLKLKQLHRNWVLWGILLTLGVYTHLMFGWLIVAFVIYLFFDRDYRNFRQDFFKSVSLAIALFSPWVWVIYKGVHRVNAYTSWMQQPSSLQALMEKWADHVNHLLFDLPGVPQLAMISIPMVIFGIIWTLWRGNRKASFLLALVMATSIMPLVIPDLIQGGMRSLNARYMIPALLCMVICVAYLVSCTLSGNAVSRMFGYGFLASMLISTACFGYEYLRQDTWWNKFSSYFNPMAARLINDSANPLIIADNFIINPGEVLSLSYLVKPETPFLLVKGNMVFDLPKGYDLFVLNPSGPLLENLMGKCELQLAKIPGLPWWASVKK